MRRRIDYLTEQHPGPPLELQVISPDDASILGEQCDILAPNAVGAILNPGTIPQLRARMICGGAITNWRSLVFYDGYTCFTMDEYTFVLNMSFDENFVWLNTSDVRLVAGGWKNPQPGLFRGYLPI